MVELVIFFFSCCSFWLWCMTHLPTLKRISLESCSFTKGWKLVFIKWCCQHKNITSWPQRDTLTKLYIINLLIEQFSFEGWKIVGFAIIFITWHIRTHKTPHICGFHSLHFPPSEDCTCITHNLGTILNCRGKQSFLNTCTCTFSHIRQSTLITFSLSSTWLIC